MQDLPKEWLEFLRGQFPAGSRIQTWELDDPKNTLEEAGTLEHIDDEGRFHVRQSDGDHRILTLGEDTFSVHPPESQLKLYMPLTASFYARNEWGDMDESGEEWDGRSLLDYEDGILSALVWNRMPEEAERGLMHWYGKEDNLDAKVRSAVFTVEARDGVLWGVAECQVLDTLSPQELNGLKDYIEGQTAGAKSLSRGRYRWRAGNSTSTCGNRRAGASRLRRSGSGRHRPRNRTIAGSPPK